MTKVSTSSLLKPARVDRQLLPPSVDAFDSIRERMGEIVQGVNAPSIPGAVVRRVHNPIEDRIPKLHVGIAHVDLGPQHVRAVRELPLAHPGEEVEVFFYAPSTIRARLSRLVDGPPEIGRASCRERV